MVKFFHLCFGTIFSVIIQTHSSGLCEKNDAIDCVQTSESVSKAEKYLPEFNAKSKNYDQWKEFYNLIEESFQNNSDSHKLNSDEDDCDVFLPLIESDLIYFEKIFHKNFLTKEILSKMIQSKRGVHYQIIDGKLYRQSNCMFPSRCEGIEHFLLRIIKQLPNIDLVINVRDYPQVPKYYSLDQQWPIFSFSKESKKFADLIYPAWTFWSGGPALDIYPNGIGRWDQRSQSLIRKQNQLPWSKKKSIAFFRGSRTSHHRDPLIHLSRSHPDLINASYTKNQAWKSKADTLGEEPAQTVPFEEHCHYRYLINAHGVAASFRFKHLFLCRSLVLNIESDWIEFFYPPLKKWMHFVPVDRNLNDLLKVLEFLEQNQLIASRIAKRGFDFIKKELTLKKIECYWLNLLLQYSDRLIAYRPNHPDSNMILIYK